MRKNGFTLVELLAVIVLIGLLTTIGVPGVMRISSRMKTKSLNTKIELIESSAVLWGQDNKSLLKTSENCIEEDGIQYDCKKIEVGYLISEDYLNSDNNSGDFLNPIDDSSMKDDCIYVYKKHKRVYAKYDGEASSCE